MEQEKESKISPYLIYAILFVSVLVVIGITATYAYFKITTSYSSTLNSISATADCINISYGEENTMDEEHVVNLDYNYPISDTYALEKIDPVIVTVKNNCTSNISDVGYSLAITSLANSTGYISDDKIKIHIKRQLGTEEETTFRSTGYLSGRTMLTSGSTYNYLMDDLSNRANISSYTNKTSYILDSETIANGETNTYKIYLWVDYHEGDITHSGLNDNSTQGQNFAAAISLVVNAEQEKTTAENLSELASADLWDSPLEGDGYRFVGQDPNNYICFGTKDKDECIGDTDKYMYRIIGIFEDAYGAQHFKLIKKAALDTTYAWHGDDTTDTSWGASDLHTGLNGSYFLNNTEYSYLQDTNWYSLIDDWDYIAVNTMAMQNGPNYYSMTPYDIYYHEMNSDNKTSTIGEWTTVRSKIGLMYVSDYVLSLGAETLNEQVSEGLGAMWIILDENDAGIGAPYGSDFTIARLNGAGAIYVTADDCLTDDLPTETYSTRPVFYLKSNVALSNSVGSISDPYIIQ